MRTALDSSGVIEPIDDNLVDQRNPLCIRHSLASQLRILVLQRAMGCIDLSDTDTLRRDPLWQLACSDAREMTPLAQGRPSQATLSRLLSCLSHDDNIDAVHEGLLRLANWRLTSLNGGERPKHLTLDIDGRPSMSTATRVARHIMAFTVTDLFATGRLARRGRRHGGRPAAQPPRTYKRWRRRI